HASAAAVRTARCCTRRAGRAAQLPGWCAAWLSLLPQTDVGILPVIGPAHQRCGSVTNAVPRRSTACDAPRLRRFVLAAGRQHGDRKLRQDLAGQEADAVALRL